jgi:hypothetical protein
MGRKGVSKRKPKKSRPFSSADINGSSQSQAGTQTPVQSLVKDKGTPFHWDGKHPSTGSKKTQK